jgi:hypothetical protein
MGRRSVAVILGLAGVWWADAHIGHLGGAFHAPTLRQAQEMAQDQYKLIFMYVTGPGAGRCEYLDRPTAREAPLVGLLVRETIITVLDRQQNAEELQRYALESFPGLFLLAPDGSVLKQYDRLASAPTLTRLLEGDLAAGDAVARARRCLASKDGQDALARERLARVLVRTGAVDEGVRVYGECLAAALDRKDVLATNTRRVLLRGLIDVAAEHKAGRNLLDKFRERVEERLLKQTDVKLAQDWAELNDWLGENQRTLALYEQLSEKNVNRFGLFDRIFDLLIEARRYEEVLALIDPQRAFQGEAFQARSGNVSWLAAPRGGVQRGTRAFAVARGARLVEALAATGAEPAARQLIDSIWRFKQTAATGEVLLERLARVEAHDLRAYVRQRWGLAAPADTPTSQPTADARRPG